VRDYQNWLLEKAHSEVEETQNSHDVSEVQLPELQKFLASDTRRVDSE
jgi:hypothetical protein